VTLSLKYSGNNWNRPACTGLCGAELNDYRCQINQTLLPSVDLILEDKNIEQENGRVGRNVPPPKF
jgi:hypothetical protein